MIRMHTHKPSIRFPAQGRFMDQWINVAAFSIGHTFLLICQIALQWRHNERDGVSNHQPKDCLLNRLFRLRSLASRLFAEPFVQAQIKENIRIPRHWPLCGEFTGDRWIPLIKGQQRGKCFHLMTSSWKSTRPDVYTRIRLNNEKAMYQRVVQQHNVRAWK